MKQTIKINERELKHLIKESVKKVLNEEYFWWGDTKPLEEIYHLASQIAETYQPDFDNNDYDEDDRARFDLWKWAKDVATEAEKFIHCEAHNTSINGGADW